MNETWHIFAQCSATHSHLDVSHVDILAPHIDHVSDVAITCAVGLDIVLEAMDREGVTAPACILMASKDVTIGGRFLHIRSDAAWNVGLK